MYIMRQFAFYVVLIALAACVVRISLAILRTLRHSMLLYVVLIPIWVTMLATLLIVARVLFKRSH